LIWSYNKLCRHGSHRALIQIERDAKYPDMWRVVRADGSLSDLVNRTRAKDAAMCIALRAINDPARSARNTRGSISPREGRPCGSRAKAANPWISPARNPGACGGPARTDYQIFSCDLPREVVWACWRAQAGLGR
jgi:hypothetical protein